ncbi:disintegrin and metalloproteinase domain-containing protein 18-like isoform X4 [Neofelis nebulosa]|uniref:disintegrin and metalloproteinase domain-containing protein 18-like isoform X4 n=1 Tax=Neofelis nebulosa TaxID=61452 RepID=UPI00272A2369|nr:disintegrin and metalloproteinase domain-containing protein 18-like isoform X4 [Neofelis nebulosa]
MEAADPLRALRVSQRELKASTILTRRAGPACWTPQRSPAREPQSCPTAFSLGRACKRFDPAMFLLFALLCALGGLHALLDSEEILLHVTVPWKIKSNESEDSEKQVIYVITIDEKPYTLHLRKHSFLSQNFLVYTYNETGFLHSESSYFKIHCHYQGYIANFPNSLATLSICSGLRGFLQFENISYGIEPLESSARFEHIIYQLKNDNQDIPWLAENYSNIWQKDQSYKDNLSSQKTALPKLLPQYLEIHIIVEKDLYDYMGSEMMAVTQKIIQITGLVNTLQETSYIFGSNIFWHNMQ